MSMPTTEGRPTTVISVRGGDRAELLADPDFVYVGRRCAGWPASPWSNPYTKAEWGEYALERFVFSLRSMTLEIGPPDGLRIGVKAMVYACKRGWKIERIEAHFRAIVERLPELRGKTLGCWCGEWRPGDPPLGCHARVLAELADGPMGEAR